MTVKKVWMLFGLFLFLVSLMTELIISSINVNGLRDIAKAEQVIFALNADILCIQETHWTEDIMDKIKQIWSGDVFVSHGNQRACGVAILIKKVCN